MTRNLKVLGLAVMAMFALGAVAASSASAKFVSDSHETILTAESTGVQKFTTPAGLFVECNAVNLENTVVGTEQESITAHPVYGGGCTVGAEGVEAPAYVFMNGCDYLFTTDTEVHIECEGEEENIEVKGEFIPPFKSKCLDIPPQTPTNPEVHYENQGSGTTMHVEVVSTVEGITYTPTGVCGAVELHHDAAYHGEVTITGEDAAENHVAITVEH